MSIIKLHSGRDVLRARLDIGKRSDGFLVCHGFSGSMHEPEESAVMKDLAGMGYTVMIVSHATGRRPDLIFPEQVRQLVDAVTYLTEVVHVRRVHLFGISMGASNAVSAGAIDTRIASVAASSGIADCKVWLQQRLGRDFDAFVSRVSRFEALQLRRERHAGPLFEVSELLRIPSNADAPTGKVRGRIARVSAQTVRSLLTYRPILAVPGIRDKPVFFFHGTGDQLVSYEHTLQMYRVAEKPKYKLLIRGGDYGMILIDSVRKKILSTYLRWLRAANILS